MQRLLYLAFSISRGKKSVLVYAGLHRGDSFDRLFRRYRRCYGFEADPVLFAQLKERFGKYPNVHLFNLAVSTHDGETSFNITSNDGASSSIGHLHEHCDNYKSGQVRLARSITVECVHLYRFLQRKGVTGIDDYVSDIQGMDLAVLTTLKPLIDDRKIGSIQCEVGKNDRPQMYPDLPPNNEGGFTALLAGNYELGGTGWGLLKDGEFREVPEDWWEMDRRWRVADRSRTAISTHPKKDKRVRRARPALPG